MHENIILQYEGKLTQEIISKNMDSIENSIENLGMMGKVATVTVELSQNMMTYSKTPELNCTDIISVGFIEVTTSNNSYTIQSKNIIDLHGKNKLEKKLSEIKALDISGIKKRYKELRRSGENAHDNNGGIGFYEIARNVTSFDYSFEKINQEKYYMIFNAAIKPKVK